MQLNHPLTRSIGRVAIGLLILVTASTALSAIPRSPCLEGQCAAQGSNEERILASLNGRTPHFNYSIPADPVTTREVTVTSASQFNSEAARGSVLIYINDSFSGDLSIVGTDVDVVMSNAATITGQLDLGSGSDTASRIRWTGGNLLGRIRGLSFRDVLFDDFSNIVTWPEENDLTAYGQQFSRLAFINTTLQNRGYGGSGGAYALFIMPPLAGGLHQGLILGNVKSLGDGIHQQRLMGIENLMQWDSAFNADGRAGSAMRFHYGVTNLWVKDSWYVGRFHHNQVNNSDSGPSFVNAVFDNLTRYARDESDGAPWSYDYSFPNPNSGVIRNSTLFNSSGTGNIGFSRYVNGGGNANETWDQSTIPDFSRIGAIR